MVDDTGVRFGVPPNEADWYYCAVIDKFGETDYIDGYAAGAKPTRAALQDKWRCTHSWVAGMMRVHDEDVESVAASRPVDCQKCHRPYSERNRLPMKIIEWEVKRIPQSGTGGATTTG